MNQIKIGWGRREVSTKEPVSIPGQVHLRISEGIHDKLYVTALCVDGGEGQDSVIFCSCDVISLRGDIIRLTRERVKALDPQIPVQFIFMGATHTHSGATLGAAPEVSPDGKPIYSSVKYREFFADQCAQAIVEAWNTRAPGGIAYGYGYAVVAHSRRTVYMHDVSQRNPNAVAPNGHAVMYGNTNDEWFSGYEAGADHFVNAMYTFDAENRLTGIVANVPCPSQISEQFTMLSADYWTEVRRMVAQEFGEDVYVMPQCAAAGDLSPRILHYQDAQERRMALKYDRPYNRKYSKPNNIHYYNKVMTERLDIAQRIVSALCEIYDWASKDIQTEMRVCHRAFELPLHKRRITEEEKLWCEENIQKMKDRIPENAGDDPEAYRKAVSTYNSIKARNEGAIRRFCEQEESPIYPVDVNVVRLGEIAFCTTPFELYMDFMHRVQARSPFVQTFVVQLAGDIGSTYLPTSRGRDNKGYSASLFCNIVGPEGGQEWVEGMVAALKEMSEQ